MRAKIWAKDLLVGRPTVVHLGAWIVCEYQWNSRADQRKLQNKINLLFRNLQPLNTGFEFIGLPWPRGWGRSGGRSGETGTGGANRQSADSVKSFIIPGVIVPRAAGDACSLPIILSSRGIKNSAM